MTSRNINPYNYSIASYKLSQIPTWILRNPTIRWNSLHMIIKLTALQFSISLHLISSMIPTVHILLFSLTVSIRFFYSIY